MTDNVKRVQHSFPVPSEVKKYMANPVDEILFTFIDPTEALVRLLVMSPLAGYSAPIMLMYNVQIFHFSMVMIISVHS